MTEQDLTTSRPSQNGCYNNGLFYANGADIETEDPCEHCYCLNNDMVCAIQVPILTFLLFFVLHIFNLMFFATTFFI